MTIGIRFSKKKLMSDAFATIYVIIKQVLTLKFGLPKESPIPANVWEKEEELNLAEEVGSGLHV